MSFETRHRIAQELIFIALTNLESIAHNSMDLRKFEIIKCKEIRVFVQ
jgi:hypothetical protein